MYEGCDLTATAVALIPPWPFAACHSHSLSPIFCPILQLSYYNKGTKILKIIFKKTVK